jgi:hypothetical protein
MPAKPGRARLLAELAGVLLLILGVDIAWVAADHGEDFLTVVGAGEALIGIVIAALAWFTSERKHT